MKLSADILYDALSEHLSVTRIGGGISDLSLGLPVFYRAGMTYKENCVYVGRTGELPPPDVRCLVVSVGGKPAAGRMRYGVVFSVGGRTDVFEVFNILQETFEKYSRWSARLQEILDGDASIAEMIRITAPVLQNSIGLCNNNLELEAVASPSGVMDMDSYGPVGDKYISQFLRHHEQNTAMREPFTYEIDGYATYCINIYKQETYLGLLTLGSQDRPFKPGDFKIFDYFFRFVYSAAEKRLSSISGQLVTIKSVYHDLISCIPVEGSKAAKALKKFSDKNWCCAAIKPSDQAAKLPPDYLCSLLESHIPESVAVFSEPYVAMLIPSDEKLRDCLVSVLNGMSMTAGLSFSFDNIINARHYFIQAVSALEMSAACAGEEALCRFEDYALSYFLYNSTGALSREFVMPDALWSLLSGKEDGSHIYAKTLKTYLDNEMNATQTARDLYIHRTTLQSRLDKIKKCVDYSTPEKRLYLRCCIYAYDYFEGLPE